MTRGVGVQRAIRPRGPTAHPASRDPKPTLLNAPGPTIIQPCPPSLDRAVPASPTATSERPRVPGMYATADMYPCGSGPVASVQVRPPSVVSATLSNGVFGVL